MRAHVCLRAACVCVQDEMGYRGDGREIHRERAGGGGEKIPASFFAAVASAYTIYMYIHSFCMKMKD